MSEHRIAITLKKKAAIPVPGHQTLHIGDTVVYVTNPPDLSFRVEFPDSPFARGVHVIKASTPHRVTREGTFESRCFITPKNGKEVGWRPNARRSGGEHDVKP